MSELGINLWFDFLSVSTLALFAVAGLFVWNQIFPDKETKAIRDYRNLLKERPALSGDEFVGKFFSDKKIDPAVPIQLRIRLEEALGENLAGISPADNLSKIFSGFDFGDFLMRKPFQLTKAELKDLSHRCDGTFYSFCVLIDEYFQTRK